MVGGLVVFDTVVGMCPHTPNVNTLSVFAPVKRILGFSQAIWGGMENPFKIHVIVTPTQSYTIPTQ